MRAYAWLPWFALDIILVVVFAISGMQSHAETIDAGGVTRVAWPFLVGLAAATLLTRGWKTINEFWPAGVLVWLLTVILGLALRALTGGGVAWAFVLVAAGTLGLFLLGRRAVAGLLIRNRVKLRG